MQIPDCVDNTPTIQGTYKLYLPKETILSLFRHLSSSVYFLVTLMAFIEGIFPHKFWIHFGLCVTPSPSYRPRFHRSTEVRWSGNFRISTLCNFLHFISSTWKTPVSSLLKTSWSIYIYITNKAVHSLKFNTSVIRSYLCSLRHYPTVPCGRTKVKFRNANGNNNKKTMIFAPIFAGNLGLNAWDKGVISWREKCTWPINFTYFGTVERKCKFSSNLCRT